MLIGLISDTHDNEARTRQALRVFRERDVRELLHMGDLASGRLVPLFAGFRVHLAQGNVDTPGAVRAAIDEEDAPIEYGVTHELALDGCRIGLMHGDDASRLRGMIESGAFELVLHGHTHEFRDERVGTTRVVNPGAVHRASQPSVCVYETREDHLERILLAR